MPLVRATLPDSTQALGPARLGGSRLPPGLRTFTLCLVLIAADGALLTAILVLGRHAGALPVSESVYRTMALRVWLLPVVLLILGAYPGYAIHPVRKLRQRASVILVAFLILVTDLLVWHPEALALLPALAACHVLAMVLWPLGNRLLEHGLGSRGWWGTPVVLLGAGREGRAVLRALKRETGLGLIPMAFYDDGFRRLEPVIDGVPVRGPLSGAAEAAAWTQTALIAMPSLSRERVTHLVASLPFHRVLIVPDMDGIQSMWLSGTDLGGRFALDMSKQNLFLRNRILKRAVDLLFGIPIALAAAPVILLLAALVRAESPGSPFYFQVREGRDGRRIRVWKLRTMYTDAQARLERHLAESPQAREEWEHRFKLKADPRILPGIGRFLRRTSLDELPQIWNVLRGDMSLVGPRPFPHYHLDAFGDEFRRLRCSVLPGMTGLWQVSARGIGDLQDQERLDSFYIHNWSLWLDLDVLLRTAWVVVRGTGS